MTLDVQQLFERFAALPQCIVLRDFDPGNELFLRKRILRRQ